MCDANRPVPPLWLEGGYYLPGHSLHKFTLHHLRLGVKDDVKACTRCTSQLNTGIDSTAAYQYKHLSIQPAEKKTFENDQYTKKNVIVHRENHDF